MLLLLKSIYSKQIEGLTTALSKQSFERLGPGLINGFMSIKRCHPVGFYGLFLAGLPMVSSSDQAVTVSYPSHSFPGQANA